MNFKFSLFSVPKECLINQFNDLIWFSDLMVLVKYIKYVY